MFSAVPERTKEELESILGRKFMGYVSGNFSDFERQEQRGSTVTDYDTVDENDVNPPSDDGSGTITGSFGKT